MHLVQLLLPVYTRAGAPQPVVLFQAVEDELTERFGGLTTYLRSPARGRWRNPEGAVEHDDVVVCEVMVEQIDPAWWAGYRTKLARRFGQDEIVARSSAIERL
jgi:hypothetical protein